LGIFGCLWLLRDRISLPGLRFCLYLVLSGSARFAVESIRINPRVLWGLSEAQLISIATIVVGCVWAVSIAKLSTVREENIE